MIEKCYICLKPLREPLIKLREVVLEDDGFGHVCVGPDCFALVVAAGPNGVRSGKGRGPMVFATTAQARAYVESVTITPPETK